MNDSTRKAALARPHCPCGRFVSRHKAVCSYCGRPLRGEPGQTAGVFTPVDEANLLHTLAADVYRDPDSTLAQIRLSDLAVIVGLVLSALTPEEVTA